MSNWHDGLTPEDRAKVETAAKAAYESPHGALSFQWEKCDEEDRDSHRKEQLAALRAIGVIAERDVGMEIAADFILRVGADVRVAVGEQFPKAYLLTQSSESVADVIVVQARRHLASRINAAIAEAKEKP